MTRKLPREIRIGEVIEAAVEVFVERGYEGASMDLIARRAGLTKGGLYHHFRSKDELLLAANERFMEPVRGLMAEARARPSAADGLRGFLGAYLAWWRAHPRDLAFIMLTLYKVLATPESWSAMSGYTSEMRGFYRELLERAVAAGEIPPCDAEARSVALLGALDGMAGFATMDPALGERAAEQLARALVG